MMISHLRTWLFFIICLFVSPCVYAQTTEPQALQTEAPSAANVGMIQGWYQGFDVRMHIGPGMGVTYEIIEWSDSFASGVNRSQKGVLGLYTNFELGYRWKYGGIYLHEGFFGYGSMHDHSIVGANAQTTLVGRGFIPLSDQVELSLGVGLGIQILGDRRGIIHIPISVGGIYHFDDFYAGAEIYFSNALTRDEFGSELIYTIDIHLTALLGYTF